MALNMPLILPIPKKMLSKCSNHGQFDVDALAITSIIIIFSLVHLFHFVPFCLELASNSTAHHSGNLHSRHLSMPSNCFPQGLTSTKN